MLGRAFDRKRSVTVRTELSDLESSLTPIVEGQLLPGASRADQCGRLVPQNFEALASLGLFAMAVPESSGGLGLSPPVMRRVLRMISSGCGTTAFAFAQHHGTASAVASTTNTVLRERWLPALCRDTLAGIAFAHLRRPGPPVLQAEASGGKGWVLRGQAPWVTSWGTAEVVAVAAATTDGRIVWSLIDARESEHVTVAERFELAAMNSTQTVALRFDGLAISAADVLDIVDLDDWAQRDRLLAVRPSPLCLGVGDRALRELERAAPAEAEDLAPFWSARSARAEEQCRRVDEAVRTLGPGEGADGRPDGVRSLDGLISEVADARADTVTSTLRLCTALASASGGAALELDHAAQRLHREAMFYVVQAQSGDGKTAMLRHLARTT